MGSWSVLSSFPDVSDVFPADEQYLSFSLFSGVIGEGLASVLGTFDAEAKSLVLRCEHNRRVTSAYSQQWCLLCTKPKTGERKMTESSSFVFTRIAPAGINRKHFLGEPLLCYH